MSKIIKKRYNLSMSEGLYDELKKIAEQYTTTVLEVIKKLIKIGLIILSVQKTGGKVLIVQEKEEREIVIIF